MAKQAVALRSRSSSPVKVRKNKQPLFTRPQRESSSGFIHGPIAPSPDSFSSHSSSVSYDDTPFPQPTACYIDVDPNNPIVPPSWIKNFRPRLPPQDSSQSWQSPIPKCDNIGHAILLRDAMTKFHLAVYLADEDAGESDERLRQALLSLCKQYMPAMVKLGVKKHQIVFFYHGRGMIRIGNEVWQAMTDWEMEQYRIEQLEEKRIRQGWQDRDRHVETTARMRRNSGFAWGPTRTDWDTYIFDDMEIKW